METKDINELKTLAMEGNALAQRELGNRYMDGEGVPKDEVEGIRWLTRSVDSQAANNQSTAETLENIRKAAEQGNANAQYSLGEHYDSSFVRDYKTAAEWYRKAAEQGHAKAQWQLGNCYDRGKGVEKDRAKAAEWWRKSAALGNADAKRLLDNLKAQESLGSEVLSNDEIDRILDNLPPKYDDGEWKPQE